MTGPAHRVEQTQGEDMDVVTQQLSLEATGVVGLNIIATAKSKNSKRISDLRIDFAQGIERIKKEVDYLYCHDLISEDGACTIMLRALHIDRAVFDELIHQLTIEAI